ncbi:MAG: hypothetical protein KH180_02585 [Anaerostipes sp.]|nr:hypothetical protein [Anaerostipes sp.]
MCNNKTCIRVREDTELKSS